MNSCNRFGILLAALGTFTPVSPGTNPVAAPARDGPVLRRYAQGQRRAQQIL
jgi:hypothetical protein